MTLRLREDDDKEVVIPNVALVETHRDATVSMHLQYRGAVPAVRLKLKDEKFALAKDKGDRMIVLQPGTYTLSVY